ncbi:MAG: zinc ribbon domain-containing protein [Nitrosopumilus sp.]|nr:zinc ribbon domain-containing protein [Nitrosopumilus sp.]
MNFESELKKGNFLISECPQCKKTTWPPSEFCNQCLGNNTWRKSSGMGIIIEFSKKENIYFCVAEIEDSIKIMGEIDSGVPEIGSQICIINCGITNGNYFFKLKLLD